LIPFYLICREIKEPIIVVNGAMEEETGEGTIDSYDDFLDGVTLSARGKEEMDVNKGPEQSKAGEKIPADMGTRVKKARESRGLSIFDLYLRSDIDVVTLSQIEEGEVVPPLGTVIKLAKALDLKMGYFISGEEASAYTIVRRDDRKVTPRYDSKKEKHYGYEYVSLAPHKTDRHMEPFLVTLEPSETEEERSTHDGQEFIFVLNGEMEVRLGEEILILEPGDSIYYDSTIPHLVKCHGKEDTKILAVLYTGK
jgi:quercetin dioxygenase-like cupin family protein/DNA-binding XRE family transcriptional regulator